MRQAKRTFCLLAAALALAAALSGGCGGAQPPARAGQEASGPAGPEWSHAPGALELTFVSDPFLNEREGAASPLPVCVYQLEDPSPFRDAAASAPGMARLLECGETGPGVVSASRVLVQPGRDATVTLDRHGRARYVAVACGFHAFDPAAASRVYEIPLREDTSGWLWWKQTSLRPAKLARKIVLGRNGIEGR